ncbi:hypothetical protein [Paraburkholderia fungorum]|uniref:hypothetical protein n=1 Tax=Paraburkholderia fungorum TaxID=134537 RepID=UPI00209BA1F3|nr:hypothetical protein [Paraburkholderia fungorum]
MSDYVYQTTTNTNKNSKYDVLGHLMPARAFFFVTVDEVGPEGFLVRRTYSTVNDPYLKSMELTELQKIQAAYPEKPVFGPETLIRWQVLRSMFWEKM